MQLTFLVLALAAGVAHATLDCNIKGYVFYPGEVRPPLSKSMASLCDDPATITSATSLADNCTALGDGCDAFSVFTYGNHTTTHRPRLQGCLKSGFFGLPAPVNTTSTGCLGLYVKPCAAPIGYTFHLGKDMRNSSQHCEAVDLDSRTSRGPGGVEVTPDYIARRCNSTCKAFSYQLQFESDGARYRSCYKTSPSPIVDMPSIGLMSFIVGPSLSRCDGLFVKDVTTSSTHSATILPLKMFGSRTFHHQGLTLVGLGGLALVFYGLCWWGRNQATAGRGRKQVAWFMPV